MPRRLSPTRLTLLASFALAVALAGCAASFHVRVEPNGSALDPIAADSLASSTDISSVASVPTTEAPDMRTRVLEQLRTQGVFGQRAADLLTIGFPERTASVPVLVRGAKFSGTDAIIVVEAWGSTGGKLVHRRLWVFDRATGAMLRAASFR